MNAYSRGTTHGIVRAFARRRAHAHRVSLAGADAGIGFSSRAGTRIGFRSRAGAGIGFARGRARASVSLTGGHGHQVGSRARSHRSSLAGAHTRIGFRSSARTLASDLVRRRSAGIGFSSPARTLASEQARRRPCASLSLTGGHGHQVGSRARSHRSSLAGAHAGIGFRSTARTLASDFARGRARWHRFRSPARMGTSSVFGRPASKRRATRHGSWRR
jgi:hypothetical protein